MRPRRVPSSWAQTSVTRSCLSRAVWPRMIWMWEGGTSKRPAKKRIKRSLALPSTGEAFSRILIASAWIPTMPSSEERGITGTVSNQPSFVSRKQRMAFYQRTREEGGGLVLPVETRRHEAPWPLYRVRCPAKLLVFRSPSSSRWFDMVEQLAPIIRRLGKVDLSAKYL
jgi:hypothetical protein